MIEINFGKVFENSFRESVPAEMYYLRLKDPANSFGTNDNLRFTSTNPFDCLIFSPPYLLTLELKSTSQTSFSFKGKTPMIKAHQIKSLTEAAQHEGIIAGLVLNFREPTNRCYFLHIYDFNKFVESTTKSSINEKDIVVSGAVNIEGKLKRVKYKYDIEGFLKQIKKLRERI